MKKGLISSRGFQKLVKGHPWIMASDIEDMKSLPNRATTFDKASTTSWHRWTLTRQSCPAKSAE